MDERMGIAQEAAIGFAKQLHKDDQAEVIDFDSQVRILSPFTNDGAALEKAIRQTTPNGSTSLYNALYIAMTELKRLKNTAGPDIRRQAIVLLSDGDDTSSLIEFDQVLDLPSAPRS
jgi:Mg-chelatase subunit ChlD